MAAARKHRNAIRMFRLRKAKCSRNFAPCAAPDQTRDLCCTIDSRKTSPRTRVVEVDAAVVRTAADGYEAAVPGAEGHSLDGGVESPFVLCCCVRGLEDGV